MLSRIRKSINKNSLYSWMIIFIIIIHASALLASIGEPPVQKNKEVLTKEEFKSQIEARQEKIRSLAEENKGIAVVLALITMLIFAALIVGSIFLIDYLIKKYKYNIDIIPKTQNPVEPLWSIGDVIKVIILFLFFSNVFSIFAHIIAGFSGARIDRRLGMIISTGGMDLLVMLFILHFVIVRHQQKVIALGISFKNFLKNLRLSMYAYLSFLPIVAVILLFVLLVSRLLNYTPPPEPIYELIFQEKRVVLLIVISVLISVAGPIIEEIFFRGFLYSALRKRFRVFWAVLISAFVFSLLHTNVLGFLPILGLGVLLAYLREKTNSLMPSICIHVVHNTILGSFMFFTRALGESI